MQKWEYLHIALTFMSERIDITANGKPVFESVTQKELYTYLNTLGVQGWEMISIIGGPRVPPDLYVFKRLLDN